MREMIDSGVPWIGEIPKEWKLLRNKNAFLCSKEIVGDKSATTQLLSLTTKGVKEKGQDVVGGKVPESYDTYQTVRKGQLVMCLFDLDCSAVFSGLSPFDGMISPAYKVLDCKAGMDSSFASYWFSSVFDGRKFMHYSKNLRYTLTYDEFSVLPMVIPQLQEQRRIADFLDTKCAEINTIMEKTRASIEDYKKLKQSVITEVVTKGIRSNRPMKDSGVDCLGVIPSDWNIVRLKTLGNTQNGISKAGDCFGYGSPFVSYSDVYKNITLPQKVAGLVDSSISEQAVYSVKKGDVFFTRTSETIEEIGFSSVCIETIPNAVFAGFLIRFRPKDETLFTHFAKYYFRSEILRAFFVKEMNLVTRASLSQGLLKTLPVPIPPYAEQQEIAAYLDEKCTAIDSLISSKEALITELEVYKKSIIYEYVTGKKEVL